MRYCFNELNPMVKEKEKENMGLQADIHKTNGKAFIMVNGRKYPIQVSDLTIRSGEPLGITAYVEEVPSTYQMFVTMPRHAGCSEAMKFAQFAKEMLYGVDLSRHVPEIKDVKFEDPATIVFWADGTKTVVRAQDEAYDPEKGLAMALSRKALGNRRDYYHVFLKWLKKFRKKASTTLPLTDYERDILDDWEKQFAMEED